jgi:hypothetical protein
LIHFLLFHNNREFIAAGSLVDCIRTVEAQEDWRYGRESGLLWSELRFFFLFWVCILELGLESFQTKFVLLQERASEVGLFTEEKKTPEELGGCSNWALWKCRERPLTTCFSVSPYWLRAFLFPPFLFFGFSLQKV